MRMKSVFRWLWPEYNSTNEKISLQKQKIHTWKYFLCNYIGYVEAKMIDIYCQKRVQSHAAQEGPKYRGQ